MLDPDETMQGLAKALVTIRAAQNDEKTEIILYINVVE